MFINMTRALSLYVEPIEFFSKMAFWNRAIRKQTRSKMQLDLTVSNKAIYNIQPSICICLRPMRS